MKDLQYPLETIKQINPAESYTPTGACKLEKINFLAASSGALTAFRHAGPDPASSLAYYLDTGFRRYDGYAASSGALDPR